MRVIVKEGKPAIKPPMEFACCAWLHRLLATARSVPPVGRHSGRYHGHATYVDARARRGAHHALLSRNPAGRRARRERRRRFAGRTPSRTSPPWRSSNTRWKSSCFTRGGRGAVLPCGRPIRCPPAGVRRRRRRPNATASCTERGQRLRRLSSATRAPLGAHLHVFRAKFRGRMRRQRCTDRRRPWRIVETCRCGARLCGRSICLTRSARKTSQPGRTRNTCVDRICDTVRSATGSTPSANCCGKRRSPSQRISLHPCPPSTSSTSRHSRFPARRS